LVENQSFLKNQNFGRKSKFFVKIEILVANQSFCKQQNFGRKSKYFVNSQILVENQIKIWFENQKFWRNFVKDRNFSFFIKNFIFFIYQFRRRFW